MIERITITFNQDGSFRGASSKDFGGLPIAHDVEGISAVLNGVDLSALERINELEEQLATAQGQPSPSRFSVDVNGVTYGAAAEDVASWVASLTFLREIEYLQGDISSAVAQTLIGPVLDVDGVAQPNMTVTEYRMLVLAIGQGVAANR